MKDKIDYPHVASGLVIAAAFIGLMALIFSTQVRAQTIVTKDYHAGTAPKHCWIYHDSGGIEGGALDPNLLGGISGNAEWSFPEPRISFVEFGQVGCKNSGASFLCSDDTNRNPLTDPNLLPQVVQYCLTANHRLGGANRAAHATVEFDGLDGTYTQIKHVLVTDNNQMDYYRGCLPSCSSVGHTGKSIVDGKIVCDKDKDSGFIFNTTPVCE